MRPKIIDADTGKELWRAVECAKHCGITWSRPVWWVRPLPFTGKSSPHTNFTNPLTGHPK